MVFTIKRITFAQQLTQDISLLRFFIIFVLTFLVGFSSFAQLSDNVNWVNHKVSDLNDHVQRAQTIFTNVRNNSTFQDLLSGVDITLPAKILPSDKDERYALYLDSLNFTKDYAYATIYMVLDIGFDKEDEKLIFVGKDIRFSRKGGFTGSAILQLAQSVDINLGEDATVTFLAEELYPTYVKFDCNGFKEISLSANIAFESSFAYPVDENNQPLKGQRLETKFNAHVEKWENWLTQVEIQKFQLAKLPDFTFDFGVIAYDHSDVKNPSGLTAFPSDYNIAEYYGGNESLWRGLYIKSASITMPRMFHKKSTPRESISINGYDLFIDKTGFSGLVEVDNLLSSEDGDMSTWDYSVDHLMVDFSHGTLVSAGLEGAVTLPVSSEGDEYALGYAATIMYDKTKDEAIYDFTASTESKIDFNIFNVADVELYDGAELNVLVVNKKFKPTATLSGNFKLTPDMGKASEFTVEFEKMQLATESPYISFVDGGGAALARDKKEEDKVGGFPIEITKLGLKTDALDDERLGLDIELKLNFMGADGTGLSGDLGLIVWGKRNNTVLRYEYDDLDLTKIGIEYETTSLYIKGSAQFFKGHKIYGDGFKAELEAVVADKIDVSASGFFGTALSGYRYWLVDMEVGFPTPIAFFPGAGINSFMGGAYYHMSYDTELKDYIPNDGVSLGLKAGIGMQSIPSDKAFGGKVQLELNFDNQFRFNFLRFQGELQFVRLNVPEVPASAIREVAEDSKKSDESKASAIVGWDISYNVPLKTLSGTVDTYIKVPADNPILSGKYTGGDHDYNAGTVSLYFSENDWFVYVGTPARPLGFNFKIGDFNVGEVTSYFVMGTQLPTPPMAAVPKEVGSAISNTFDPTMLKAGAGVGLGFRFGIDINATSPRIAGISGYFNASLGAGFDVLFMKSDQLGSCAEISKFGVNNWYGYGQIYVYASASVGADIKVNLGLWKIQTQVDLLSLSLATYMYFQGPNPTYAMGAINAKATALGCISCEFNFDVEFGDAGCGKDKSDSELQLFNYAMPTKEAKRIDPYVTPTVYLSVPIGKKFSVSNPEGDMIDIVVALNPSDKHQNYLRCISCSTPYNIETEITITRQGNLVFKPLDALPSNETFKIHALALVQNTDGSSYGKIPDEEFESTFTTRAELMQIPASNIAYAYPLPEMENFYKDESNLGYISTLVKPQLPLQKMEGYIYQAQFYDGSVLVSTSNNVTITNARGVEQFKFPIPSTLLKAGKSYIFKIVQTKEDKSSGKEGEEGNTQFGTTEDLAESVDSVIVQYSFKTSKHNTFSDKMASMAQSEVLLGDAGEITQQFSSGSGTPEAFSEEELEGYSANNADFTKPFIQVRYKSIDAIKTIAEQTIYVNHTERDYRYNDLPYDNAYQAYSLEDKNGLTVNLDLIRALQLDYNLGKQAVKGYKVPDGDMPMLSKSGHGYFLDYFLPGKTQENSSVLMQYNLIRDVAVRK